MNAKLLFLIAGALFASQLLAGCLLADEMYRRGLINGPVDTTTPSPEAEDNTYGDPTDDPYNERNTQATINAEDNPTIDPADDPNSELYASKGPTYTGPTPYPSAGEEEEPTPYVTGLPTAVEQSTNEENSPTPSATPTASAQPTVTFTPGPATYQPFTYPAFEQALENDQRVYLYFYSSSNAQCQVQEPVVVQAFQGMSHDAYFNGLAGFHVDFGTEAQLQQTYNVNNAHTHVFIGANGAVLAKTNDAYAEMQLVQTMRTTFAG